MHVLLAVGEINGHQALYLFILCLLFARASRAWKAGIVFSGVCPCV